MDDINNKLIETHHQNRPQKLSDHTRNLMAERRSMTFQTSEDTQSYRQLNKQILKSLRHDERSYKTKRMKETIERNKGQTWR